MKKTGIITHYYGSTNYGGNLQAYALCKYLNLHGIDAEQICFDPCVRKKGVSIKGLLRALKSRVTKIFPKKKKAQSIQTERHQIFLPFNRDAIPHSKRVYTRDTIKECANLYDVFIAGSDQIWNMTWYVPEYFLTFVPAEKIKASYAASFGITEFTCEQKKIIKKNLMNFKYVSIREHTPLEKEAVFPMEAEVVLDPTLLLPRDVWQSVANGRLLGEKYIFCYFFGSSAKARTIAKEYAEKYGYKIVNIPHPDCFNEYDVGFADVEFLNASPEDFLSLIQYAEYIFTDSFHAVAFSGVFGKKFVVFKRNQNDSMSSRIYGITALFSAEDRYICVPERENLDYICALSAPNDIFSSDIFLKNREKSEQFIKKIYS